MSVPGRSPSEAQSVRLSVCYREKAIYRYIVQGHSTQRTAFCFRQEMPKGSQRRKT